MNRNELRKFSMNNKYKELLYIRTIEHSKTNIQHMEHITINNLLQDEDIMDIFKKLEPILKELKK